MLLSQMGKIVELIYGILIVGHQSLTIIYINQMPSAVNEKQIQT